MEQLVESAPFFQIIDPQLLKPHHVEQLMEVGKVDPDKNIDEVLQMLAEGKAEIWVYERVLKAAHGLVVSQMFDSIEGRVFFVWKVIGSGMKHDFKYIKEAMENYARANGCKYARFEVRPELATAFQRYGPDYKLTQCVLEKEL